MYGNLLGLFILSADLCTRINKNSTGSTHDFKKISCIPYGTYLLDMTHQDFGAVLFWAGSGSRTHIVKIILDLLKVTYLLYSLYSLRGSLQKIEAGAGPKVTLRFLPNTPVPGGSRFETLWHTKYLFTIFLSLYII